MESWGKKTGIFNTDSEHFAVKRMKLNVQAALVWFGSQGYTTEKRLSSSSQRQIG